MVSKTEEIKEKRNQEEELRHELLKMQERELYSVILNRSISTFEDKIGRKRIKNIKRDDDDDKLPSIIQKVNQETPNLLSVQISWNEVKTLSQKPKKNNQSCEIYHFKSTPIREDSSSMKKITSETRIRVEETNKYPHSAIGLLKIKDGDAIKTATGVLIGPNLVLTAAHNFINYNDTLKRKYTDIEFYPGLNEKTAVFGKCRIIETFISECDLKTEDYAVGVLDRPVGENAGYFGLHIAEKDLLRGKKLCVFGYPGYIRDRKGNLLMLSQNENHQQWGMEGDSYFFEDDAFQINYSDILTSPGQSGSGLYYYDDKTDNYFVIGVHVQGGNDYNTATWITRKRFDKIESWIEKPKFEMVSRMAGQIEGKKISILDLSYSIFDWIDCCECCNRSQYPFPQSKRPYNIENMKYLASLDMPNLRVLILDGCEFGHEGITLLSQGSNSTMLQKLKLYMNYLGDLGAISLSKNMTWVNLQEIDLEKNGIGNWGAIELGKNQTWVKLRRLNLERNEIGDAGVEGLGKNEAWINLTILKLNDNLIIDGAALVSNKNWEKLLKLDLRSNKITYSGLLKFKKSTKEEQKLYLGGNNIIDEVEATALIQAQGWKVSIEKFEFI